MGAMATSVFLRSLRLCFCYCEPNQTGACKDPLTVALVAGCEQPYKSPVTYTTRTEIEEMQAPETFVRRQTRGGFATDLPTW